MSVIIVDQPKQDHVLTQSLHISFKDYLNASSTCFKYESQTLKA